MTQNDIIIKRLNELGYHQVKRLFDQGGNFPAGWDGAVAKWLADQDAEAASLSSAAREREASAAERAALAAERASVAAERQAVAAEHANKRATIAIVIAIISIISTIVSIVVVHFDAMRQLHLG